MLRLIAKWRCLTNPTALSFLDLKGLGKTVPGRNLTAPAGVELRAVLVEAAVHLYPALSGGWDDLDRRVRHR